MGEIVSSNVMQPGLPSSASSLASRATSNPRLPSLDGWRAIAILLVLLSHWWASTGGGEIAEGLGPLSQQGDLGVRIFFVISGFLITFLLLEEHKTRGRIDLRNFYIRRMLRIFPVYFAFLGVLAILAWAEFYSDARSSWLGSVTFTRNIIGQGRSATGHLWSLAVEEQFYLLWPWVLVGLGLAGRPRLALSTLLLVGLTAIVARAIPCTGQGMICERLLGVKSAIKYADSLAIGCAAAYIYVRHRSLIPKSQSVFFVTSASLIISAMVQPSSAVSSSLLTFAQAALTTICLLSSIVSKPAIFHAALNARIVVMIGVLSYSIYIWHMLFLSHYMGDRLAGYALYDRRVWIVATVVMAALSFFLIEKPIMSWRQRFRS